MIGARVAVIHHSNWSLAKRNIVTRCFEVAILLLILALFIPGRLNARTLTVIEFGAKSDRHGQVLAAELDPRNTPSTLAVTDDGAVWFRETFAWHPRIARFAANGGFNEFRDPYVVNSYGTTQEYSCDATQSCFPFTYAESFSPLVAEGDHVIIGPIRRNPTRVLVLSADGSVTTRSAAGCLAAGPNIACFRKSKIDITFPSDYGSFRSSRIAVSPNSAILGPDGNIWFTDTDNSQIGRIYPDGSYMTFTSGLTRWDSGPQFITVGPDGNLWFTEKRDRIGRITLDGRITEFSLGIPKRSSMGGIVAGPDGALWFTLFHGMVLGRMTLQARITLFHDLVFPSDGHNFDPVGMIVRDRRGRLYYNEGQAGRIARVTISP